MAGVTSIPRTQHTAVCCDDILFVHDKSYIPVLGKYKKQVRSIPGPLPPKRAIVASSIYHSPRATYWPNRHRPWFWAIMTQVHLDMGILADFQLCWLRVTTCLQSALCFTAMLRWLLCSFVFFEALSPFNAISLRSSILRTWIRAAAYSYTCTRFPSGVWLAWSRSKLSHGLLICCCQKRRVVV